MPYSECCGAFSYMAPDVDICPECKEHTDWVYDEDIEMEHIDQEPKNQKSDEQENDRTDDN